MFFILTFSRSIILDALENILYFPVWWYGRGLKKRAVGFTRSVSGLAHNLALKIMFTHIFAPMFGETSKSGRIISFFMRYALLSWRLFLFLLGTIGLLLLLIIWVALPAVAVWQIIIKLFY